MKQKFFLRFCLAGLLLLLITALPVIAGTTGKIAGTVTDKETGEPLPGANVIVEGTMLGGASDLDGNYTILQVPPGTYTVSCSFLGYAKMTLTDVRVYIDQTAAVNMALGMEAISGETVTIVAERDVLKKDVSTSVTAVSDAEVAALPVTSVNEIVGLQAGVQGMDIRGSGADKMLLQVDGVTMRDPRNNQPISNIPLSSVQEVSIERGGFNAEYGQVQSGVVKIVTKEGGKDAYFASATVKRAAPGAKHFGISPFDQNSMWFRPYLDDAVCWEGTGNWDRYTERQYPDFRGWNEISQATLLDNNPNNDLTPAAAQRLFLWEHRKEPNTKGADYDVDAGFGGPVPFVSEPLGNLRFFASYRRHREMLLFPLDRDDYLEHDLSVRLNSDITSSIKLKISGMMGKQYTDATNWYWYHNARDYLRSPESLASQIGNRQNSVTIFGSGHFSAAALGYKSFAADLTHMLSPTTFYEASIEHVQRSYEIGRVAEFDTTRDNEIFPGFFVDDAPNGYHNGDRSGIDGMMIGVQSGMARDSSYSSATTLKVDFTSQVNFYNQVKAGFEFVYNYLDQDFGRTDGKSDNFAFRVRMLNRPIRTALYLQDKLEVKGFIANLGVRMDYSNSNVAWWDVGAYDADFLGEEPGSETPTKKSEPQFQFSPRLGVSHPITENSKLYFNYGHFKQMPSYENLFAMMRDNTGSLTAFGNPNLILAKTIAYELGYDHSIADNYLVQLAAFYKDITDQSRNVTYTAARTGASYMQPTSVGYEDIRGFELTLRKSTGRWWSGFGNYTYQVSTAGQFGGDQRFQDQTEQANYDANTVYLYQARPIPRPYGRLNLLFKTPAEFGPTLFGQKLLENWELNLLGEWQAGNYVTWPDNSPISQNVRAKDYLNAELRFGKTFRVKKMNVRLFVDVFNALNQRRLNMGSFYDGQDRLDYMKSLHLPESRLYSNIPGQDKVGDFRREDVAFQPIELEGVIDENTAHVPGAIYYEISTGRYLEYADGWTEVEKGRMDKILDDKAYIDMPNASSFWFLNPRQIFFGLTINYDF